MKCPKCGLINPESAIWCDCGYEFLSGQMSSNSAAQAHGGKNREITLAEIGGRKVISEISGNNRHIVVTEDTIFVGSSGISSGSMFGKKVKRYPINSITSIDVRKALLTVELEIVMSGAKEISNTRNSFMDRAHNENITMFPKSKYDQVQAIAALILDLQQQRKTKENRQSSESADSILSIPKQIKELAELKNAGIITVEEFELKKKELLGRM